jgi:hypothetical protein
MGPQHFEQLTRHDRREPLHAMAGKRNPFAVGSRHADDAAEIWNEGGEAEQLGFLAAHHVLGPAVPLAHARQDACAEARPRHGGGHGSRRKGAEIGRRVEIGRLPPAMPRAGHAADQDVDRLAGGRDVGREDVGQNPGIGVGRELPHALGGGPRKQHTPANVDPPNAQVGRSPIDGNPLGFGCHLAPHRPRA